MSRLPASANPQRQPYPSDLSEAEWKVLEPFLPQPKGFGHPRTVDLHEIINAIFYVQRSGCSGKCSPMTFPLTLRSIATGIWQQIHDELRYRLRRTMGRDEDSTFAIADSQSVKTTEKRGRSTALTVARKLKVVNGI